MDRVFDLAFAQEAALCGQVHQWVQDYLRANGHWTNLGLADGLLLAPRWWLGPFQAPLTQFARVCGPEPEMQYMEPLAQWNQRTDAMAATIQCIEQVPPLIATWSQRGWSLADGNHRHEALLRAGFSSCWALGWFNCKLELERYKEFLV